MHSILLQIGVSHNTFVGTATLNEPETKPPETTIELKLQDCISRMVEQDQTAFAALFKIMSSRVYSLARRITGNAQLAEEVTEDTFFQIWRQAARFDPERGTAVAWILTIARSRALDARRSIPPFDEFSDHQVDDGLDSPGNVGLPDLLSMVEQNKMLHDALSCLEPLPRQLLALSYFRGLSHEEIAAQTALPLGTVKSHLRRSIISLREALSITQ